MNVPASRRTRSLWNSLLVATLGTAAVLSQPALGADPGVEPQTREKACADSAASWFTKNWPNGKDSTANSESSATYESHYNAKRGKCFILVTVHERSYSFNGTFRTVTEQLIDLGAQGAYATFRESNGAHALCIIEGHECKDKEQWETLVRALYLEDKAAVTPATGHQ